MSPVLPAALASALLGGLAVVVLIAPSRRPLVAPAGAPDLTGQARGAALAEPRAARLACGLAGAAALLLVGGAAGAVVALTLAGFGPRALSRLEPGSVRDARRRLVADLPLALDLLAACLMGGATLPRAAAAVADALPGPLGDRLTRVAAALGVGSPPEEAWGALTSVGGRDDPLAPVARTLIRAARGGAPVAEAIGRLAQEARAESRARGEQAARRAGVLAVAPLGLCFLPAFVLLGVVPVVAGLVGPLLASF